MTAIRGEVAPTTKSDALGVRLLDQFVLAVPDANIAEEFCGNFGRANSPSFTRAARAKAASLHHDLHLLAWLQAVMRIETVEY